MNPNDDTAKQVSLVLRIFESGAIIFLVAAVIGNLVGFRWSRALSIPGIALIVAAPVGGVIAVGIISFRRGRRRRFAYSLVILIIYMAGFWVAR